MMLIKPRYAPSERTEMLRFVTNHPSRSFEVGAREGLFSKALKKRYPGLETWGVDPDDSTFREAEKNLDHAFVSEFPNYRLRLPESGFDLIIFNDVLEHMYDPWHALVCANQLLTAGGIVIASLPNIRHRPILRDLFFFDEFEYQDGGNLDITHIRFFTRKTMARMFAYAGFRIIKMEPVVPIKKPFKKFLIRLSMGWAESLYVHQYGITACPVEKSMTEGPPSPRE